MTRKTRPEATAGPTGAPTGALAGAPTGTSESAAAEAEGGPKATVPAQHRHAAGPDSGNAAGDGQEPASSDSSDTSDSSDFPDGVRHPGGSSSAPAAAVPASAAPAASLPAVGRNGRVIARTAGSAGAVGAPSGSGADADGDTVSATAPAGADVDAHGPASGKRRSRRAGVALVAGCGVALAVVATPFVVDAAHNDDKPAAGGSAAQDPRPGPAGREAGALLRAMALTTTAIGYAPGVTSGSPAERSALGKARRDSRRYALAAWGASGRPTGDDALYGALLRSSGTYEDTVTTHFGLAPAGEMLAADVAPEGHKLAVLTRQKGSALARMQVLAFGKDATAPKWATVGPAVDPASAFAISDCGGMLAFAEPDGHREVWNLMGAEPVKAFESNGDGVDRAAGERQFLDFNNDTHRLLYAHGPRDALRGEVVAVHQDVPIVESDVVLPRGPAVGDVRLDGLKGTAVTVPVPASASASAKGEVLTRYGSHVTTGPGSGTRSDASHRYLVERRGFADDVYSVRVTVPQLGRTFQAILPAGSSAADIAGGEQTMVVPVRADGKTLRLIVITDDSLTVVDATRVDDTKSRSLPDAGALVAEACESNPEPLTSRELSALPAGERVATAAAWPCD
ncbi:hypothetical protein OTB20_04000 [Streptomyces sp. H27-H1]|uniref:hypothetical protein n=1 Tax=Streptomyces sp. H27-H1 TaxID=2996461 RepID=UPI00227069E5|nr:hypothetical protein [Streptomyces sp. H27-H1]MCY0925378.1 hypothetical protein [Streptomyces sp. H27-H1]